MAEEPTPGASADKDKADGEGEGGASVVGTPDLVLDERSGPVISVFVDGLMEVVDASLGVEPLVLDEARMTGEPDMATMEEVSRCFSMVKV